MALLLTPEEVDGRLKLYQELKYALDDVKAAQALPEEAPTQCFVDFPGSELLGEVLLGAVCMRAWLSLRASAIKVAAERLRKAEEAVRRFEAGEDI